ncbi:hypothetical protein pb186bvf_001521 [Paramecium bursaria]
MQGDQLNNRYDKQQLICKRPYQRCIIDHAWQIILQSPIDVILTINNAEDQLLSEVLEDMKNYQNEQYKNAETKQQIKHQLVFALFTQQIVQDESKILSNEVKLADDILLQRQEFINEQNAILPQIEELKKNDGLLYDQQYPELKLCSEYFYEISQIYNKNNQLIGQQQHKDISVDPEESILDIYQRAKRDLGDKNIYLMLLERIISANENIDNISHKYSQYFEQELQYVEESNNMIQNFVKDITNQIKIDIDNLEQEIQQINPIAKVTREKLLSLNKKSEDIKHIIEDCKKRYEDVQNQIDNQYTSYSTKRLADINNLNLIRHIKQSLIDHSEIIEDLIRNKFQPS